MTGQTPRLPTQDLTPGVSAGGLLENAIAETDRIDKPLRVYKSMGLPRNNIRKDDMHERHVENFLDCMRTRKRPRSDVEIGHNSMIACHLGNAAFRLGRRVDWDINNEEPRGDREAEELMRPHYRAPWKLEA